MGQQPQPGPDSAPPETVSESQSDCPILRRAQEFSCMCSSAECLMNQDDRLLPDKLYRSRGKNVSLRHLEEKLRLSVANAGQPVIK